MLQLFQIIVLIFSAIIHEYMHGWMAWRLGDNTAKDLGRLTMNPLPHLDPFGSILLPVLLIFSGSPIVFGWAKPVPFNPYNLRDQRFGPAKVAVAGPLGNFITALFFGLILRFLPMGENILLYGLLALVVQINLLLMVFNLVPLPPLDGSKVLLPFFSPNIQRKILSLERFGIFFVILFIFFGFNLIIPVINFLFSLIVG